MTTKSLACLVFAVLLGTAVSVRWYLDAEEGVHAAPSQGGRAVVYQHLPLPMRAEPARATCGWGGTPAADGSYLERSAPSPAAVPLVGNPCPGKAAPTAVEPSAFAPASSAF